MKMLKKEKQFLRQNKGITLISLIVTIIVMLILAGVGLTTLSGENGIVTRTEGMKELAEKRGVLEEIQHAVVASVSKLDAEINETKLRSELTSAFGEEGTDFTLEGDSSEGWVITVVKNKVSYFVDSEGNVEETEYEEPINNSQSLVLGFVDDLGTRAMIYLYANPDKNNANEEITITDSEGNTLKNADNQNQTNVKAVAKNEEGKLEITGTNYEDAKTYYLAYPVTENGTYAFKATKGTTTTETKIRVKNIEKFTLIDTIASKKDELKDNSGNVKAYSYKGAAVPKGYYVDTKSNVDTGLVITDEIDSNGYSTGNEWVWVPVNSSVGNDEFYEEDTTGTMAGIDDDTKALKYNKYSLLYDFTTDPTTKVTTRTAKEKKKPSETGGNREIAILTSSTYGEEANLSNNPIYSRATAKNTTPTALTSEKAVAEQYIEDYNSMVTSVETYNGFYIGRYEITEAGEKPGTSLAGTINGTSWNWYALYNKCMSLNEGNTVTTMIYGALWDATMQWLSSSYNVGNTENTYSEYGNYGTEAVTVSNNTTTITVKPSWTSQKLGTGQTSYTKSNNIYDLSGNCYDWTQEADYTCYRIVRGGSYDDYGTYYTSAAHRGGNTPTDSSDTSSSRPQLYIK